MASHLPPNHATGHRMDHIYRKQAAIYDLTRKYYLLGRDQLIGDLDVPDGGSVLEIACGTGRNLVKIGGHYPEARLFGMDISSKMLEQADKNLSRSGMTERISLAQGDACSFKAEQMFGQAQFDRIVFSYCLSMIPDWQGALRHALPLLAPGGRIHIVDFGQQSGLPGLFRIGLFAWLGKFHVTPRADLEQVGAQMATTQGMVSDIRPIFRDYAKIGTISRV